MSESTVLYHILYVVDSERATTEVSTVTTAGWRTTLQEDESALC